MFDTSSVTRGVDGIARYSALPPTLVDMLRRSVEQAGQSEAIVEVGGPRLTYRQLWDRSVRIAGGLAAEGIGPGDRVAIALPNGTDWVLAFWGTQLRGAIAVPINTRLSEPEIDDLLRDADVAYVMRAGEPLPDATPVTSHAPATDDIAVLFYTSRTGTPKGAMATHRNLLSNAANAIRSCRLAEGPPPRGLISVPLFHVTACNSQLLTNTMLAGTSVIMPSFDAESFLETIETERTDSLAAAPAIYWRAMNQSGFLVLDTSHVRRLAFGGAPAPPDLVRRLLREFPNTELYNGYGLTETSSLATVLPHEHTRERPETVGFPVPVVDVAVDTGRSGSEGELLVRGPNVVPGYWNKPRETADAFVDGWLRTGDTARIDAQGFVEIIGRTKDLINRGGEKISSGEVEAALTAHPEVAEAGVVGVPDEMMGEKVGAAVVPHPSRQISVVELLTFAESQLAEFKVPQYVMVANGPLPRNADGELLRETIREGLHQDQPSG